MSARITRSVLLALAFALGLGGCIRPRPVGHFGENAFYLTRAHYRVRYESAPERTLLSQPWRLASYEIDPNGRPVGARQDARFWMTYDQHELLAAGRPRPIVAERFDLYFEHEDGRAVMWARTIPIRRAWQYEPASNLIRAGVLGIDRRSGPVPDLLGLGTLEHVELASEPEVRPARVDATRAEAYTFDLARGPDPAHLRLWRVTVVALRSNGAMWRVGRRPLPSLIVLGYASAPQDHDAHRAAFESLVRRVDLAR